MLTSVENQVIALAGIFQAINTVKELAYKGQCDSVAFDNSIRSVLSINAASVADIYDNNQGIMKGLSVLREQLLSGAGERDHELSRYAITIIHLEARLRSNNEVMEKLKRGLVQLESQAKLNTSSDTLVANMASLYQDTISQLTPRIMVNGEAHHLSNDYTASKIRAVLLSAIRAAVLWRQCGGSRLKLLFQRKKYQEEADRLIARLR